MSLFLLTFLLLYGGMHYYIFTKVRYAFTPGIGPLLLVAFFMLLMVIAPLIVYAAGKHGWESFARLTAFIGYTWMGFAFLFFSSSVVIDLYHLLAIVGGLILRKELASPVPLLQFLLPLIICLSAGTYGFFDAKKIRTERITIKSSKIPPELNRFRIVQISDVHLGIIVREERLSLILNEVKKAGPDLFISTGDLVDGQINHLEGLAERLQGIQPRYGKFAITGNHEFYAGLPQALNFTRRGGFTLLRGEGVTIGGWLNLAGVDDPAGRSFGLISGLPEKELLSRFPRDKFMLFLKHRPVVDPNSLGLFDLQISGHTHKGQIFPFTLLSRIFFPYNSGFFRLSGDA
ncbi:MAG TPA: metallophosphoesterase, partial [Thermodesulfobacteriota bacterium]|nr:metallophosphoesterase [Thermodesulfobacteriota bacterium]